MRNFGRSIGSVGWTVETRDLGKGPLGPLLLANPSGWAGTEPSGIGAILSPLTASLHGRRLRRRFGSIRTLYLLDYLCGREQPVQNCSLLGGIRLFN